MAAIVKVCSKVYSFRLSDVTKTVYVLPSIFNQQRSYAVRKNTKKLLKRAAKLSESQRKPWLANVDQSVVKENLKRKEIESKYKGPPVDNVWIIPEHKPPLYSFQEALKMHRETHHPAIYNEPDALLYATLELDMKQGEKKSKPLSAFRGMFCYPNYFEPGEPKRILALCNNIEDRKNALDAGAIAAGGSEIISQFKSGDLTDKDFDHMVVHSDMVTEVFPIRGFIKHHFPSKQRGNLGSDMGSLVLKFLKGVEYKSDRDLLEPLYSTVDICLGRLSMLDSSIEENLKALLVEIDKHRPPNIENPFIISLKLWSPPSSDLLYIPFWQFLPTSKFSGMFSRKYTVFKQEKSLDV